MENLYIETQQETLREIKSCIDSELACTVVFGQIGSGKSWIARELYYSLSKDNKFLFGQELFNSLGESDFIDLVRIKMLEVNEFIMILDFDHDDSYRIIVDILNIHYQITLDSSSKNVKLVFFTSDKFREVLLRFNNLNFVNVKNITGEEAEMFFDRFVGFGINEYRLRHLKFLFRKTDHSPGEILRLSQRKTRKKNAFQFLISSSFYGFCAFLVILILIMYALFDVNLFNEYGIKSINLSIGGIPTEFSEEAFEKTIEENNGIGIVETSFYDDDISKIYDEKNR